MFDPFSNPKHAFGARSGPSLSVFAPVLPGFEGAIAPPPSNKLGSNLWCCGQGTIRGHKVWGQGHTWSQGFFAIQARDVLLACLLRFDLLGEGCSTVYVMVMYVSTCYSNEFQFVNISFQN